MKTKKTSTLLIGVLETASYLTGHTVLFDYSNGRKKNIIYIMLKELHAKIQTVANRKSSNVL
jgi:hypothetical protein